MAEQSLKDKTVKGVAWSGIDNVAQMGVTFLVSIVLARLLSPDDYGLIGIITIFTMVCNTLINAGFNSALICKKDCSMMETFTLIFANYIYVPAPWWKTDYFEVRREDPAWKNRWI